MYVHKITCMYIIHTCNFKNNLQISRYACIGHIEEIDTRVFHKRADFV